MTALARLARSPEYVSPAAGVVALGVPSAEALSDERYETTVCAG
jgi:hypothetical protein